MNTSRYYQYIFPGTIAFSVVLMLIGLSMGHPEQLLSGLWKIVTMQDLLITDYIHIAGPAAAFVNAGARKRATAATSQISPRRF